MRRKQILILTLPLLLASCQGGSGDSVPPNIGNDSSFSSESSSSDTTSSSTSTIVSDVRQGLIALSNPEARFLVKINKAINGNPDDYTNYRYFAPKYFSSDDKGYIVLENGLSSFSYDYETEKLSLSEILCDDSGNNYTSLSEVTHVFSEADFSKLILDSETPNTINVLSKRTVAITVLQCLGLSESLFFSLKSFKATLTNPENNNIDFVLELNDDKTVVTASVSSFGKAKLAYLENYLRNPTAPFEPTAEEKRIRSLFKGNNFTQLRDNDNDDVADQHDYFTKDYYFIDFTEEYSEANPSVSATYGNRGYLSIIDTVMMYNYSGKDYSLYFNGCYMFYLKDGIFSLVTRPDPDNPQTAQPSFTQNYTDITYVMNYPSNLLAINHFESYDKVDGESTLRTEDNEIMLDFVANFNLADTITSNKLTLDHLDVKYDLTEDNGTCKVTFDLCFVGNSYVEYIFTDFGTTAVQGVEDFMKTYQD